jgi:glycosyltransferase involved in cell wall biosynthesis
MKACRRNYYGGTERVVSYLTEELVRQGHEVTLFASGDSETNARLEAACPRSVEFGQTGFVVEGLEDAVEGVRRVAQLSRKRCREMFEQRFTATRMAHDYVQQFERLIARNQEVSEAA